MTTETLSQPPPVAGVGHRGPESSEVDLFRDGGEGRSKAEAVPTGPTLGGPFVPALEVSLSDLVQEKVPEEPTASEQQEGPVEKAPLPPAMPSEEIKMAGDESHQSPPGHDVNDKHGPSSEQPKAGGTSSPLPQEEDGHAPECHGETPNALSDLQPPPAASVSEDEKESSQPPPSPERDMAAPVEPPQELDVGQGEEGSSPPHQHDNTSDFPSEGQNSTTGSVQLGLGEENGVTGRHGQLSSVGSGPLEETGGASSPKEADSSEDSSQAPCAAAVSPQSPSSLLWGANSPDDLGERGRGMLPSLSASPAESQGTSPAESIQEDTKAACSGSSGEEERSPREHLLLSEETPSSLREPSLRKDSGNNPQATEVEQVAQQDTACHSIARPSSLEAAGPQAGLGPSCQQRAAGTGCEKAAQPAFTPSPVATARIFGPAHQESDDGHAWEEQAIRRPTSGGSGEDDDAEAQVEAGGKAVQELEKGEERATPSPEPEGNESPEGARDPTGAKEQAREQPGLGSPAGASHPAGPQEPPGAMVLASAEDPHEARERADSQDLAHTACPVPATHHGGANQAPREGLLLDPGDPAELACATPAADEPSAMEVSGCPADWAGGAPEAPHSAPETPIEREIRLHLEREELLRRERGLASPRGTQEYVEVRIRPILNQTGGSSSTLPKEKERQRAGVQMQREIQRECQREEDLVQLGKVRGAYDRGTPIELQEKKMLFEQHFGPESPASRKAACGSHAEGSRGPSFTEANPATPMVILDSGALLRAQRPQPEKASSAHPFVCLRAKSPPSLLEQEVQEAQERERELQRQRYSLYGSVLPSPSAESTEREEDVHTQPERPSCKKLDVTWPPPSSSETSQVNGLHQLERSPRVLRRQRSALIERWESGAVGKQEDED